MLEAISSGEGGCRVTRGHFHNSAVRILRGRAARIEQQRAAEAARTLLVLQVSPFAPLSLYLSLSLVLLHCQSSSRCSSPPPHAHRHPSSPPAFQTFSSLWLTTYLLPLRRPCALLSLSSVVLMQRTFSLLFLLLLLASPPLLLHRCLSFPPRISIGRPAPPLSSSEFFRSLVSLQLSSVSLRSGYNTPPYPPVYRLVLMRHLPSPVCSSRPV